jgi:hypothetical protein
VPSQVLDQLDLLRRDGVNVRPVARSEAHELELPAGALDGLVYVGDPACPTRYYLYSDFHLRAFEFKFTEAISLLGALGARSFEVRSEEGWDRRMSGKLTLPVQAMPVTGKVSIRRRGTRNIVFKAELDPVGVRSPDNLHWLRYEPMWRQLISLRKRGLQRFSLVVESTGDQQITAEVGSKIKRRQLGIGGEYNEHIATKWVIEGEFAAPAKRR